MSGANMGKQLTALITRAPCLICNGPGILERVKGENENSGTGQTVFCNIGTIGNKSGIVRFDP